MALTSTLYTGLSGLDVNQTRLNVVGNNIANVNTVAFKGSRALFKPQFYLTDSAGAPPSDNFGGSNPSQRGLGALVSTIQKNFQPGPLEVTGKDTDLALDGDGFFIVQGKDQRFTRDGSFTLNASNQLVNTAGDFVQGFGADDSGNIIPGLLGNIEIPLGSLTKAEATETVEFTGNLNANGAVATVGNIQTTQQFFTTAAGTLPDDTTVLTDLVVADPTTGAPTATTVFTEGTVTVTGKRGGRDLPPLSINVGAATTIADLRAFFNQAMGIDTTITTADSNPGTTFTPGTDALATAGRLNIEANVGTQNAITLSGSALSVNTFNFAETQAAVGESVFTSFVSYDSLGTPLNINMIAVLESKDLTGTNWRYYAYSGNDTDSTTFDPTKLDGLKVGTGTLAFDTNGKLKPTTPTSIQITRENTGADGQVSIALDFSKMNALADSTNRISSLFATPDGSRIGTLSSFSIGTTGLIVGTFDNGLQQNLGQVAVATFDNPEGLVDLGGNMYSTGGNSSTPKITAPLQLAAGAVRSGSLELSNVDLSDEFVSLITATTGFSAASRIITTSDRLLTELLNTAR